MDIVHEFPIETSAEKLYAALTTQVGINGWWAKDCQPAAAEGGVSVMRFNKQGQIVEMQFRVDELQDNQGTRWTCVQNPNPAWINTQLEFAIRENGSGSMLRFAHTGWDAQWKGQPPYEMTKETWQGFMTSLKNYCENGVGAPW